jgi:hypothetical protein
MSATRTAVSTSSQTLANGLVNDDSEIQTVISLTDSDSEDDVAQGRLAQRKKEDGVTIGRFKRLALLYQAADKFGIPA